MVSVVHVFCIVQSRNADGPVKCQSSSGREEKTKTIYVTSKKTLSWLSNHSESNDRMTRTISKLAKENQKSRFSEGIWTGQSNFNVAMVLVIC